MYPSATDPWQVPQPGGSPPGLPGDGPADLSGPPDQLGGAVMYGRAPVPPAPRPEPTEELPVALVESVTVARPKKPISWQRSGRASLRSLADGWGLTATGAIVAFSGWGIWAAAGRGTLASPLAGMLLTLAVAALLFALTRLLGFLVLERMFGRPRLHARWSHLVAGLFLCFAGLVYLSQTSWIIEGTDRIGEGIDWIRQQWQRLR